MTDLYTPYGTPLASREHDVPGGLGESWWFKGPGQNEAGGYGDYQNPGPYRVADFYPLIPGYQDKPLTEYAADVAKPIVAAAIPIGLLVVMMMMKD